jgi:hypothetical protein
MFGTVVRLGAMKISVAWEDGEERSVSKDIQLAYCMTVHKFQEVRAPDVCVIALNIPTMASVLDRRWIYADHAQGTPPYHLRSGIFPVGSPVAKQKLTNLNFKRT